MLELRSAVRKRVEKRAREMAPARRLRFELALAALDREVESGSARVLDAGCGEGLLTTTLALRFPGWDILGIDLNEEMLERARSAGQGLPNLRFARADVTEDLGSSLYDVVVALECLEEIPDDEAALANMARSLRSGGLFLVQAPERHWTPVLRGSEHTWRHEVRHGYSASELEAKLSSAELDVVWIVPTSRGTVALASELRDRIKASSLKRRMLAYPGMAAAVRLERLGLTWGPPRSLFVVARRR